jgi:hypothetical protein
MALAARHAGYEVPVLIPEGRNRVGPARSSMVLALPIFVVLLAIAQRKYFNLRCALTTVAGMSVARSAVVTVLNERQRQPFT